MNDKENQIHLFINTTKKLEDGSSLVFFINDINYREHKDSKTTTFIKWKNRQDKNVLKYRGRTFTSNEIFRNINRYILDKNNICVVKILTPENIVIFEYNLNDKNCIICDYEKLPTLHLLYKKDFF